MLFEVVVCEHDNEWSGSGLLLYSRNISQGAYVSGEIKGITPVVIGKPIDSQARKGPGIWCESAKSH